MDVLGILGAVIRGYVVGRGPDGLREFNIFWYKSNCSTTSSFSEPFPRLICEHIATSVRNQATNDQNKKKIPFKVGGFSDYEGCGAFQTSN